MKQVSVEDLIEKYIEGSASGDEIKQVDTWYDSFNSQQELYVADTPELKQALAKRFLEVKLKLLID